MSNVAPPLTVLPPLCSQVLCASAYALVRDLVPVKDPATDAPVLWDNVTETYFRNAGKYLLAGGGAERPFDSGVTIIVR